MVTTHGLAATIRASQESETFDLGGQNVDTITKTIETAFQEPLLLDEQEMIRLTFVVGAGKQSRQKYAAGASKAVTSTLLKCGYQQDKGASCVEECGGTFKTQHDTAKNLYTVVVYPKVVSSVEGKNAAEEEVEPLIPEDSPGYKIAVSSMPVFRNMATAKCSSWSQKRACLECIQALQELLQELDDKLVSGTPLDASEQTYYDSCVLLTEKASLIKQEAQELVEQGKITSLEKEVLLQQNAERIASLEKDGKSTTKALERKQMLQEIEPVEPLPLKYQAEIGKLYKELVPLLALERETKGRLLNIKETQQMARKDEIEQEMEYLQESSRGWFEDDDVFDARVQACLQTLARQHGSIKRSGKSSRTGATTITASTKTRVSANKWVTPGSQGFGGAKGAGKKSRLKQGGSLFGAMMMDDSSSDEEEDEENDEDELEELNETSTNDEPSGAPIPSKKKKRSKRKKKKAASVSQTDETITTASTNAQEDQVSVISQLGTFLQSYLLPLIVGLLSWLFSLVFGRKKKQS